MSFMSMAFLAMTAGGAAPTAAKEPDVPAAIATIKRLTLASPTPTTEAGKASLDRLQALVKSLERLAKKKEQASSDLFNALQVARDTISLGSQLAEFPEEALCWQWAGLNLAKAQYRQVYRQVNLGLDFPQTLDQVVAQLELFRSAHQEAKARVKAQATGVPAATKERDVAAAVATIKRLAKASHAPKTEEGIALHTRLEALVKFLDRLVTKKNLAPSDLFNVFQVARDTIDAGHHLTESPEQDLC